MNLKHLFGLSLLLLCSLAPAAEDTLRTIATVGTASVSFSPDRAYIPVRIDLEAPTFTEAEAKVAAVQARVREALKRIGLPKGDITNDSRTLKNKYEMVERRMVVTGRACIDRCTVLVRNLELVNEVVRALAEIDEVFADEPNYASERQGEAKRDALLRAGAAAREKAELLAKQAGVKIKGVLQLGEESSWGSSGYGSSESQIGGAMANSISYSAQRSVSNDAVTVTVHARYLIE